MPSQYARTTAPPDSADDIEAEIKRAHTQQQLQNAAMHALWRLRQWEQFDRRGEKAVA